MRIDEIIAGGEEPCFSFEFFPPKTPKGESNLHAALQELTPLDPSFASVTYGAGGSTRRGTIDITKSLKQELGVEAMAHLTCVGATTGELRKVLDEIRDAGIENVLALRGDPPAGETVWTATEGGLTYSTQLAEMIREDYDFCIGAACFPEVHPEAESPEADLRFLREKVEAGASFLITQLFFDNRLYFDFVASARAAGIEVPIIPGIIPITDVGQLKRMTDLCKATIPPALLEQLESRADRPEAVVEFGVAYATLQCSELLARGAPGIHFYTINKSAATRAILSALRLHRPWDSAQPASAGGLIGSA